MCGLYLIERDDTKDAKDMVNNAKGWKIQQIFSPYLVVVLINSTSICSSDGFNWLP